MKRLQALSSQTNRRAMNKRALYSHELAWACVGEGRGVFWCRRVDVSSNEARAFGDHTENEPDEPGSIVQGRIIDRFLQ